MTSRRRFISLVPFLGAATLAHAADAPAVDPKDPQAVALGYVVDATKADKTKYPQYAAGQSCAGCALYQGAPGSAAGPCPIFQSRQVHAKAWCGAYVKRG